VALLSSAPVSFGIVYDFRNPPQWHQPWERRYREILEQIDWIETEVPAIGGAFVTEHHFFEDGYVPASMIACAAIAARTERLTVGTNILPLPLYQPVHVAEEALVIDALSAGRFQLGVGAGYIEQEFMAFGSVLKQRPSRLEEGIEIIRAAFRGEPFSYAGKRYQVPEIKVTPPPIREGGPELWMGAQSPVAIDRAARLGDGLFCTTNADVLEWKVACERHGRPPEHRHLNRSFFAIIDEDPERAYAEAGPHFMHLMNEYVIRGSFGNVPPFEDPASARRFTADVGALLVADAVGAVATIDAAIEQGATDIHLVAVMPGEPIERTTERLRYFADQVAPAVRRSVHPSAGKRPPRHPELRYE
jgi:alkanesulfonate monooxygenase SsuD/methylene tetrahydromethanopterin reductase-like flavin-dependent oxidoreductase (luciferase family)